MIYRFMTKFYCSKDKFSFSTSSISGDKIVNNHPPSPHRTEYETISHIKFLCSHKTSAIAALNAGLYAEAIRNFSKIVESRHGAPQGFLATCYTHRASAYRCAGRIVDSLADCNRALALDPSCIDAFHTRAALFEAIRCLMNSLHDLQYYALFGLMRGCSRSELEIAHLLLTLRHKPDKSSAFINTCEFADSGDVESVRERAKASSLLLYRLIQNGYNTITKTIQDEEAVEKQRKKASAAEAMQQVQQQAQQEQVKYERHSNNAVSTNIATSKISNCNNKPSKPAAAIATPMFQRVSCRDIATVGNLQPHSIFHLQSNEALSC